MALIDCPECGNEVSEQADSCPKCGYPINETTDEQTDDSGVFPLGCLGWIGFFILANFVGFVVGGIVLALTSDSEAVKNPDALALVFGTVFALSILGQAWWKNSQAK